MTQREGNDKGESKRKEEIGGEMEMCKDKV